MIIGVDIGGTKIRAGLVVDGKLKEQSYTLLANKDSRSKTLAQVMSTIAPLIRGNVRGIGVGVPSVVDPELGIVYDVVNIPSWKRIPLKTLMEKEFGKPVFINNDVNCFVLGEHRFGIGKPFSSIVGLTLGTGLGAGIIANNRLYSGSNCGAGEIGLLPYLDKNFEFYTSSAFFVSTCASTAAQLHEDARQNKPGAMEAWEEYGRHLGNAVKAAVYAYDPEVIIIGGSIAKAYKYFERALRSELKDFAYPGTIKKLKIIQSQQEDITVLGAAALVG
jgi:glucokinase